METKNMSLGMLVILNSGSPPLTVIDIDDDADECTVTWINEMGQPQTMDAPAVCFKDFSEIGR